MAKFLFVYRSPPMPADMPAPTPEQMQEEMGKWGAWFQQIGPAVVDGGDGLMPAGTVVQGNGTSDGPFSDGNDTVSGYSVIQADSPDAAAEFAKACPVVAMGGSVEIRQFAGYSENL